MKKIFLAVIALCAAGCTSIPDEGAAIVERDGRFHLYVDGEQTYIKGVGGTYKINVAAENGANAFRTWGGNVESVSRDVEIASKNGMYIMQGIGLTKDPAAYRSEEYKNRVRENVRSLAEAFKDDRSILIWGIGNEIELNGDNNDAVCWGFVDELSKLIKSIDKRHLTATVIAHNAAALDSIAKYAPSLDLIGINSYGPIAEVEKMVDASAYKGAYLITEWGPTGWWETAKTEWGAPIEQTSEQKRQVYEERYNNCIFGAPRCLGSFVFLWGQKEERTPTWFCMFVEDSVEGLPLHGERTPMVEAMERVWNRCEPDQTAPVISGITIGGRTPEQSVTVDKGQAFTAEVVVKDRENDTLSYVWEVLKEATVTATGGAYEPRPDRVGEVMTTDANSLALSIAESGNYRLYVYVLDNTGFVSTANIPFRVGE